MIMFIPISFSKITPEYYKVLIICEILVIFVKTL